MWYKNIAGRFFGLVTKHACDRWTDGRTDGQNYDSQDRASIAASRGKNEDNTSAQNTKLHIIKKRMNNKVSFVEFILYSWQCKLMTTRSQPHGARWPRLYCAQMIETMS